MYLLSLLKGMDSESWGLSYKGYIWHNGKSRKYTEPFYDTNTVIGILLDLSAGTLSFYRNGVNLGDAFTGLGQVIKHVDNKSSQNHWYSLLFVAIEK